MKSILPTNSTLHATFTQLLQQADTLFFVGLPGVGKSLLLQQCALLALDTHRPVHLLQWDQARLPFESPQYPLHNGATHPTIIKAVGIWLRPALTAWHSAHHKTNTILLGEAPLIGGRFIELAQPHNDPAEPLLASPRTRFLLPVPSPKLRSIIEAARQSTTNNPQHPSEIHDAPPALLQQIWRDFHRTASQLGLTTPQSSPHTYDPDAYTAAYQRILRHRHLHTLPIDQPLNPTDSVYALPHPILQLAPDPHTAQSILASLESPDSPHP